MRKTWMVERREPGTPDALYAATRSSTAMVQEWSPDPGRALRWRERDDAEHFVRMYRLGDECRVIESGTGWDE